MEPVRKGFSMVTELLVQYGAKVDVESTVRREGGREGEGRREGGGGRGGGREGGGEGGRELYSAINLII